ncbi:MAG: hypothetical protein PVJ53_00670 [Desulfobacterales bacterium]|jgi:hypothetical protein
MQHQERHLIFIAAAISAVGALFLSASLFSLPFLTTQPPGSFFLSGISICLLFAGIYYCIKACRGQLKPKGKTITDVRMQAVEKMQGKALLSRIAREDPDKAVRQKAIERLEKIAA